MIKKKKNLIVFDWNGTILADTSACWHATNKVLEKLGLPRVTISLYRRHYTMPIHHLYHALGVDPVVLKEKGEEINPLWHDIYWSSKIRLRNGAKKMLERLRKAQYENLIVSNYLVDRIEEQAQLFGIRDHFTTIIAFGTNEGIFRRDSLKGKGARLEAHLQKHPAQNGIIIGDSEEEIEIGHKLGLATVALTGGMCSTSRLRAMKPDYLVTTLSQIPAIADKVFYREHRRAS